MTNQKHLVLFFSFSDQRLFALNITFTIDDSQSWQQIKRERANSMRNRLSLLYIAIMNHSRLRIFEISKL